jgi:anti-sigma-K factor RskA
MSPHPPSPVPDDLLAAEYVIGVLPHAERARFAQRLSQDARLQQRVAAWERQFAHLNGEFEAAAAPASVWSRIEGRLFPEQAQKPAGWWQSLFFWRSLASGALAAAAVFATILLTQPADDGASLVAQLSGESDVKLVAYFDPKTATLRLNRTAGNAAEGRTHELWLIAGGNPPVSLGILPDDSRNRIVVPPNLRPLLNDAVLAISDEPAGGSPTGHPTGAVLAAGPLTSV